MYQVTLQRLPSKLNISRTKIRLNPIAPFFVGLKKEDLLDGEGRAVETVEFLTHNGTRLDRPYHFHSTMDNALGDKKPAIAIHDVLLEWCFQHGVKLDFRHFADGYMVTSQDIGAELKRIKHPLQPLEIVVINTAAGMKYGHANYVSTGCCMGRSQNHHYAARRAAQAQHGNGH